MQLQSVDLQVPDMLRHAFVIQGHSKCYQSEPHVAIQTPPPRPRNKHSKLHAASLRGFACDCNGIQRVSRDLPGLPTECGFGAQMLAESVHGTRACFVWHECGLCRQDLFRVCNANGGMRPQSVDMSVRQVLGAAAHLQGNRRHGQGCHVLSNNRLFIKVQLPAS